MKNRPIVTAKYKKGFIFKYFQLETGRYWKVFYERTDISWQVQKIFEGGDLNTIDEAIELAEDWLIFKEAAKPKGETGK